MIPVCIPSIGKGERENVLDAIDTNWISSQGKYIEMFERSWSEYCGVSEGIACSNGTTALHLALRSIGVKQGDEVIVPAFTMYATIASIIYCGAKPVLVDCEPDTWNMNVDQVAEKLTDRTAAILPVHIYGHPVEMDPITEMVSGRSGPDGREKVYVLEDAAEAHGALYRGKKAGSMGDLAAFSFYANKIITTGEGGMVITSDPVVADRARRLRNMAFSPEKRFLHDMLGYNYRMTNIQAAIGAAQVPGIEDKVKKKRAMAEKYTAGLKKAGVTDLRYPVEREYVRNVYWMYGIVLEDGFGVDKDTAMVKLREEYGVDTRSFFIPMHLQPIFNEMGLFKGESYPVSEELGQKGLYLPSSIDITDTEIETVIGAVLKLQESSR